MRRLFTLIAAMALVAAASAAAQDHGNRHGMDGLAAHGMSDSSAAMLAMLTERLSLTDEQVAAALPHVNAMHTAVKEAHELLAQWHADSASMNSEAVHEKLEAAHTRIKSSMEAFQQLLTDEQRETFREMHGDMEHRHMRGHDDDDGPHDESEHEGHDGDGSHDGE